MTAAAGASVNPTRTWQPEAPSSIALMRTQQVPGASAVGSQSTVLSRNGGHVTVATWLSALAGFSLK